MDRREFFSRSFGKAAEKLTSHVDEKVARRAVHWIRPPFAISELEFLLACTRCDACINACPHKVIFPLAARLGADVMGTPALDLLNKGCQLCEDWPCVQACESNALNNLDEEQRPINTPPQMAKASIDTEKCLPYSGPECGACNHVCKIDGALTWQQEKPSINQQLCVGCGMCREACIVEDKAITICSIHE